VINTKQYNNLSYVSFEVVFFGKYTLLPVTVNVMKTFLEATL